MLTKILSDHCLAVPGYPIYNKNELKWALSSMVEQSAQGKFRMMQFRMAVVAN